MCTFLRRLIRVINGALSFDGVPVVVNDEGNGLYSFYIRIPWPGKSQMIAELIHPSEAVLEFINQTSLFFDGAVRFFGHFPSGSTTLCDGVLR